MDRFDRWLENWIDRNFRGPAGGVVFIFLAVAVVGLLTAGLAYLIVEAVS